jgi:hypothetical protein
LFIVPFNASLDRVERLFEHYLPKSRFRLLFDRQRVSQRISAKPYAESFALRLLQIRLKNKKYYCGQHPGPCPINRIFAPPPHPLCHLLEGLDWVSLDDMVNDILDRHSIEALVWSHGTEFDRKFFIRRHQQRRTNYPMRLFRYPDVWAWETHQSLAEWDSSHFGVSNDATRSRYPEGTPGVPEWRLSKGRKMERLLLVDERKERGIKRRIQREVSSV